MITDIGIDDELRPFRHGYKQHGGCRIGATNRFRNKSDGNRSYFKFCWYGPKPAAAMIQASGVDAGPRASIVRRQLR